MKDMKISGSSTMAGGEYDSVSISGSGAVDGNIKCTSFSASGSAHVRGSVEAADSFRCSGSAHVDGDASAKVIKCSGAAHVGGNVSSGEMSCSGAMKVDGNINAKSLSASGSIKVSGDAEADEIVITGCIKAGGLISGDKVEIRLSGGGSSAQSVGGGEITVMPAMSRGLLSRLVGSKNVERFSCETIEGDRLELENVTADTVRGAEVRIGGGCRIKRVEYSQEIFCDDGAAVEEKIKI